MRNTINAAPEERLYARVDRYRSTQYGIPRPHKIACFVRRYMDLGHASVYASKTSSYREPERESGFSARALSNPRPERSVKMTRRCLALAIPQSCEWRGRASSVLSCERLRSYYANRLRSLLTSTKLQAEFLLILEAFLSPPLDFSASDSRHFDP